MSASVLIFRPLPKQRPEIIEAETEEADACPCEQCQRVEVRCLDGICKEPRE